MSTTTFQRLARVSAERRLGLVALALFAVGLAWSALSPWLARDGVPGTEPWVKALASVRDELQAGDTVWVQPPWRDDVVDALEEAGLPKGVKATVALAQPHGQAPGRTLLLHDPAAPLPRARRAQTRGVERERVAGVDVVWLGTGPQATGDIDFLSRLALADVHVEKPDGKKVKCSWSDVRDRHVCRGLPDWMYVGPQSQTIGGKPARCAWSHPITGGKVVIRWQNQTLPKKLHLAHALTDTAAGSRSGAPVTMTVRAGGREILKSVRTNARGFKRDTAKVPPNASSLELVITTPNDGVRHYCWQLRGGDQ